MPKASSSELMRGAAAQLIRAMEQKGIVWWIYDGYSIRRMHQTEIVMDTEDRDGSRSSNREQEPQPEGRDLRGGQASVEAGDHDGESLGGETLEEFDEGVPSERPERPGGVVPRTRVALGTATTPQASTDPALVRRILQTRTAGRKTPVRRRRRGTR